MELTMFVDGKTVSKGRRFFLYVQVPSIGKVMHFDLSTKNRDRALKSTKALLERIQKEFGETVFWNFRGESVIYFGTESLCPKPLKQRIVQVVKDLFEWDEL